MMRRIFTLFIGVYLCIWAARAQEPAYTDPVTLEDQAEKIDSLQRIIDDLNSQLTSQKKIERVWEGRSKYFNIGYVNQKLIYKDFDMPDMKNDFGVSLSWGKTYYLHKKPLLGMLKFGLDWSWVDLNYAQYSLIDMEEVKPGESSEAYEITAHQAEYGMQFGPSVTINPVQDLKVSLYFRVTPSFSLIYMDDVNYNYATFFNFGGAIAWRMISLGVEGRWGSAKYNGFAVNEVDIDSEYPSIETSSIKAKLKTSSVRFYIGFRF
ncbi:MAG TPA: hypothetical protein H9779_02135 [Candidatus Alistipes avicola]|uniref:Outer membrane protein beta-barrel domain-containing protein n=1 Tax=Candidatus Alistipes avicola TaxID=2838432 RepID=A0A9D2IAT2_9BACT|nr:hypothetical protein [Candidatus Alistipes avicola]